MITAKKMHETSEKVSSNVKIENFYLNNVKMNENMEAIKSNSKKIAKAFEKISNIVATRKNKVLLNPNDNEFAVRFDNFKRKSEKRSKATVEVYNKFFGGYSNDLSRNVIPGLKSINSSLDDGLKKIRTIDDSFTGVSYAEETKTDVKTNVPSEKSTK